MKRSRISFAVRVFVLAAAAVMVFSNINRVMTTKGFAGRGFSETTTELAFYDLEENTVDVLFLGSSHAISSFIPQELYNNFGITSYNLGTREQSLVVSYYWLKEALQTQSPRAVILDAYMLFPYIEEDPLNSRESSTRIALDFMNMDEVKREAIRTICALDESQSVLSYYLSNIRYHDRWKSLDDTDFKYEDYAGLPGLMGYASNSDGSAAADYEPFEKGSSDELAAVVPLMEEYLIKIIDLCNEQGIDLILVKTPAHGYKISMYNTLVQFVQEYDIPFYDFNERSLYNEIGFNFDKNMLDVAHLAVSGSVKITNFLGNLLQTEYDLESHESLAWEESRETYLNYLADYQLWYGTDVCEYLTILNENKDRYVILIAVRGDASRSLDEQMISCLDGLQLEADWSDAYGNSYYAVIDSGIVVEEVMSEEAIEGTGSFMDGRYCFTISSIGYDAGDGCSIVIDDEEQAINGRGLNIVVFDKNLLQVTDSVCFDTFSQYLTATR